jgi:hypothetical protein
MTGIEDINNVVNNLNNFNPYQVILKYINSFSDEFILDNISYFLSENYYAVIIIYFKMDINEKFIINLCGNNPNNYLRLRPHLERKNINIKDRGVKIININILDNIYGYIKDLNYDSKILLKRNSLF